MDIQATTQSVQNIPCDALVVSVAHTKDGLHLSQAAAAIDTALEGLLNTLYTEGEFKGKLGELATLHTQGKLHARRVLVVGLGASEKVTTQSIRHASAVAARHLQRTGVRQLGLALQWQSATISQAQSIQAQTEGALLGLYSFRQYQQKESRTGEKGVSHVQIVTENTHSTVEQAIQHGRALAEATNFARDLVNEPPNVLTPGELVNRASSMARQFGLDCEVFDRTKIAAMGMGGILGVTKGSAEPPYFIILRYRGAPQSKEPGVAFVGKGITFDTGGISLKPADRMDEMKGDMGGAAAVLGAMQAIAALKPTINITGIVPTCENMPSGTAYHPGDILRIMNGKTIEIVNTDAEGRLILADALSYASKEGYSPILDLATLTGGIVVALGNKMTGLFSNNEQLTSEIIAAGHSAGEKFWPMPLDDDYNEQIKSEIADVKQTGGRGASSVTAAKILEQFVSNVQWAHLDIAGTSYVDSVKPAQEKGATGVGVRTLVEFALHKAQ